MMSKYLRGWGGVSYALFTLGAMALLVNCGGALNGGETRADPTHSDLPPTPVVSTGPSTGPSTATDDEREGAVAGEMAASPSGGAEQPAIKEVTRESVTKIIVACWKQHEGASSDTPAAGVEVVLDHHPAYAPHGRWDVFPGRLAIAPQFMTCARAVAPQLLKVYRPNGQGTQLRVPVSLPGKAPELPWPSEEEVQQGVLACWKENEGGQPNAFAEQVKIRFSARGHGGPPTSMGRKFSACTVRKIRAWRKGAGYDITKKMSTTVALPGKP